MSRKATAESKGKSAGRRQLHGRGGRSSGSSHKPPFDLHGDGNDLAGHHDSDGGAAAEMSFRTGLDGVVRLLRDAKRIVVLTGAGISVSCGIPDFRTQGSGLYSTLDAEELGLSCAEELFDLSFFKDDPRPFFRFARRLYYPLGRKPMPSDSHKLLALLDQKRKLLRVYSQNIDGLEQEAGVSAKRVVHAHGSLRWAACCTCRRKVPSDDIRDDVWNGVVARCKAPAGPAPAAASAASSSGLNGKKKPPSRSPPPLPCRSSRRKRSRSASDDCDPSSLSSPRHRQEDDDGRSSRATDERDLPSLQDGQEEDAKLGSAPAPAPVPLCGGIMKPGVTFFGEHLSDSVRRCLEVDRTKVDALIVMGTSLSVAPISKVVGFLPANIPRILINRTIVHPQASSPEGRHAKHSRDSEEDDGAGTADPSERDFRDDYVFDAYLLGYCDDVTRALGRRLFPAPAGSSKQPSAERNDEEEGKLLARLEDGGPHRKKDWVESKVASKIPPERIFLFPGAVSPAANGPDAAVADGGDASTEHQYREIAHCDGCAALITHGTIHKCAVCFDYDLCQPCFAELSKDHHGGRHAFVPEPVATGAGS